MGNPIGEEVDSPQPAQLVRKVTYLAEADHGNLLLVCASTDEATHAVGWLVGALMRHGFHLSQPNWSDSGEYWVTMLRLPTGYQHPDLGLINILRQMSDLTPLNWVELTRRAEVPDDTDQLDPESSDAERLNSLIDHEIWLGIRLALRSHLPRPRPRKDYPTPKQAAAH